MGDCAVKPGSQPGAGATSDLNIGVVNLIICGAGVIASALISKSADFALGFFIGCAIGMLNFAWLGRIAIKTSDMTADEAGIYAARNYYIRFFATGALFFGLVYFKVLKSPWALIVGLSVSVFSALISMIYSIMKPPRVGREKGSGGD